LLACHGPDYRADACANKGTLARVVTGRVVADNASY
jgi:hypothetical protein